MRKAPAPPSSCCATTRRSLRRRWRQPQMSTTGRPSRYARSRESSDLPATATKCALGKLLDSPDEQTVREALRSLARIGSGRAAALVAAQIVKNRGWIGAAAEETLWHFQRPEIDRQIRDLLARREFVPAPAASRGASSRTRGAERHRQSRRRSSSRSCRSAIVSGIPRSSALPDRPGPCWRNHDVAKARTGSVVENT